MGVCRTGRYECGWVWRLHHHGPDRECGVCGVWSSEEELSESVGVVVDEQQTRLQDRGKWERS